MATYPKAVTKLEIGKTAADHTDITAIIYSGERTVGDGPGGDHVSPQTALNRVQPTGVLAHHKRRLIVVGVAEDEYAALFGTVVSGASARAVSETGKNPVIRYLAITERDAAGNEQTTQYQYACVTRVGDSRTTTEDGKHVVEVEFTCSGEFQVVIDVVLLVYRMVEEHPDFADFLIKFCDLSRTDTPELHGPAFCDLSRTDTPELHGPAFCDLSRTDTPSFNAVAP